MIRFLSCVVRDSPSPLRRSVDNPIPRFSASPGMVSPSSRAILRLTTNSRQVITSNHPGLQTQPTSQHGGVDRSRRRPVRELSPPHARAAVRGTCGTVARTWAITPLRFFRQRVTYLMYASTMGWYNSTIEGFAPPVFRWYQRSAPNTAETPSSGSQPWRMPSSIRSIMLVVSNPYRL